VLNSLTGNVAKMDMMAVILQDFDIYLTSTAFVCNLRHYNCGSLQRVVFIHEQDATVKHYTHYTVVDLRNVTCQLNTMLTTPPYKSQKTILTKYSHQYVQLSAFVITHCEPEKNMLLNNCTFVSSTQSLNHYVYIVTLHFR